MCSTVLLPAPFGPSRPVIPGETENELVVGTGMGLVGVQHGARGCGRVDGGQTFGVESIERTEADDGVKWPELGEFSQTNVVEFDQLGAWHD